MADNGTVGLGADRQPAVLDAHHHTKPDGSRFRVSGMPSDAPDKPCSLPRGVRASYGHTPECRTGTQGHN